MTRGVGYHRRARDRARARVLIAEAKWRKMTDRTPFDKRTPRFYVNEAKALKQYTRHMDTLVRHNEALRRALTVKS
jgi:hypothetical protein